MNRPFLEYPDNFTTLYQNSDFNFPHDTILNLSYEKLVDLFTSKNYVIPYYIILYNEDIEDKDINEIISSLKDNEDFCLLGALFMYLKGLLENLDSSTNTSGINIIEDADKDVTYKSKELQNFVDIFNDYFELNTLYDFILMINLIIDVTQNIIINVVNYVTENDVLPNWFNNDVIINFIGSIQPLFNRKMKYYKGLNKTYARYIGEIIPSLLNLFEKANEFQYYHD